MRATCQARYVKSKDAFKPSTNRWARSVGKFKANYFFFVVMEEKGDATSAVTQHKLYLDLCDLSVTTPFIFNSNLLTNAEIFLLQKTEIGNVMVKVMVSKASQDCTFQRNNVAGIMIVSA